MKMVFLFGMAMVIIFATTTTTTMNDGVFGMIGIWDVVFDIWYAAFCIWMTYLVFKIVLFVLGTMYLVYIGPCILG